MNIIDNIRKVLEIEAQGIRDQLPLINENFVEAVEIIANSKGKLVVTGIGKSGIIGKKMSATFSSTGVPSVFLHPSEAFHGDLGMVSSEEVILMISNSGESDELLKIIPFFKNNGNPIVAITASLTSTLAKNADIHLFMKIDKEACPLSLAPTTSTTVTLALGDALAIAIMRMNDFKAENFAQFHPGGALGRKLLQKVKHHMRNKDLPCISKNENIKNIISRITTGRLGLVVVLENLAPIGIITDGDLRRLIEKEGRNSWGYKAEDFMTKTPKMISQNSSLIEAEKLMITNKINNLLVTDENKNLVGVFQLFDV